MHVTPPKYTVKWLRQSILWYVYLTTIFLKIKKTHTHTHTHTFKITKYKKTLLALKREFQENCHFNRAMGLSGTPA